MGSYYGQAAVINLPEQTTIQPPLFIHSMSEFLSILLFIDLHHTRTDDFGLDFACFYVVFNLIHKSAITIARLSVISYYRNERFLVVKEQFTADKSIVNIVIIDPSRGKECR